MFLFSLPFAAVGVGATIWVWRDVLRSREILTTWQPVPATIEKTDLEHHRGSKGGTTYETTAVYSYVVSGKTYRSEKLGLSSGADNIGHYHENLYRELKADEASQKTVTCYVNPADPTQAILRPAWRPEMALFKSLFGLVFSAVGLGLMAGTIVGAFGQSAQSRLKTRYPQQPWLWRAEWQTPVLRARLGKRMATAAAALVIIHAATGPLWSALPAAWESSGAFKWVLSGMLALVLVLSAFCVRVILHGRKFGSSRLELDKLLLAPGSLCNTRLYLPHTIPLGATVELMLVCSHSVTTGSGKQRRTNTTKVWTHREAATGLIGPWQAIPFSCRVPADVPVTTLDSTNDVHTWTFEAKADVPGVDLNLKFELPVFATGARVTS